MGDKGEQYTSDSSVVSCAMVTCVPLLITLMYARRNVLLNTTLNHIWQAFQGEVFLVFTFWPSTMDEKFFSIYTYMKGLFSA